MSWNAFSRCSVQRLWRLLAKATVLEEANAMASLAGLLMWNLTLAQEMH
jgi:hypothetical protein